MNKKLLIIILLISVLIVGTLFINKENKGEENDINMENVTENKELIEPEPSLDEIEPYFDPVTQKKVNQITGEIIE